MNPFDPSDSLERRMFERAAAKHVPINGSIEVSPLCNMDCDMCFVNDDKIYWTIFTKMIHLSEDRCYSAVL